MGWHVIEIDQPKTDTWRRLENTSFVDNSPSTSVHYGNSFEIQIKNIDLISNSFEAYYFILDIDLLNLKIFFSFIRHWTP